MIKVSCVCFLSMVGKKKDWGTHKQACKMKHTLKWAMAHVDTPFYAFRKGDYELEVPPGDTTSFAPSLTMFLNILPQTLWFVLLVYASLC